PCLLVWTVTPSPLHPVTSRLLSRKAPIHPVERDDPAGCPDLAQEGRRRRQLDQRAVGGSKRAALQIQRHLLAVVQRPGEIGGEAGDAQVERIAEEDPGEKGCNHRADTHQLQRQWRILSRAAAAEVAPRYNHIARLYIRREVGPCLDKGIFTQVS